MDDAVDGGVGADTESKREHGDDGEAGGPRERADRVARIPLQVVQPEKRPLVTVTFFHLFDTAERPPRGHTGLVRRHATAGEFFFKERQVRRDLSRKFWLGRAGAEGVEQPEQSASQAPHQDDSPSNSLFTSPASFRQRSACFSRARVPTLVMA